MTDLTFPGAPDDGLDKPPSSDGRAGQQESAANGRRRDGTILDEQGCLKGLSALPPLAALGVLKPAQANSMRAVYRDLLQHHGKKQSRNDHKGLSDANVLDLLQADPRILSMLEPILTEEQISMLFTNAKDGDSEQA